MPNDDLIVAKAENADSASGILADLLDGGFASLLDDKDIKHACLKELADVGCRAPANHVVWFCARKLASAAEGFVSETLKSKFIDIMQASPAIAGVLRRISNLKSGEKDKNALKQRLLEDLNATTADDAAMMAEMTTELEVVAALHTRSALQGLSGKIADLAKEIGATLETVLRDMTEPRLLTAGVDGNWERDSDNLSVAEKLKYNSGQYGFYGRERELDVLGNLLHQIDPTPGPNRFRWLLLTGPGGEGKSRLALEFCKNHVPAPWLAGKLELDELRVMVSGQFKWRPRRPTLFVIDYPAQAPEAVNAFLRMLDRHWTTFDLPVRVLLLERETSGEWFKKLVPENSTGAALNDHVFGNLREGFSISPLMPAAIIALMQERFALEDIEAPGPELLLQAAYKIDPRVIKTEERMITIPRALFASAVAEVMVEAARAGDADLAGLIDGLSQHQILDRLVEGDRTNRWKPASGEDTERLERHENLLAFATMCLGLARVNLNSPEARALRADILPQSVSSNLMNAMGTRLPDRQISALEPDILGEHYVLSRLERLKNLGLAQDMIDAAFSLGSNDFVIFCLRCLRDFKDRSKALEVFLPSETMTSPGAIHFSTLIVDVSSRLAVDLGKEQLDTMLMRLDALRQVYPKNRTIGLHEAMTAYNVAIHAAETEDWPRAEVMLARFDALRQAFPDDEEIALHEANAAANITDEADEAGEWPRVEAMFARLDALRQRFPDSEKIALSESNAIVNAANHAGKADDWHRVTSIFARIDALRDLFPDKREIALAEAIAAFNISSNASEVAEWQMVEEMFARIDAVRQAFPDNGDIALQEAVAAFNVTNNAGKTRDWQKIDAMFARFDALRQAFPAHSEVILSEAKAAANVTFHASEAGDWQRVDAMFARIDAIRKAFPHTSEIALSEAIAAVNITVHAGKAGDWQRVEAVYRRIVEFVKADTINNQVIGVCGLAVAERYTAYCRAGKTLDEDAASEAASSARDLIVHRYPYDPSAGVETCRMVIKNAYQRFPDNESIAVIYHWGTETGIDWAQVPDFDT